MDEENRKDIETKEGCQCDGCGEEGTSQDLFEAVALDEELKRIELQDNPISEVEDKYVDGDVYNKVLEKAYAIGESLQILLGYGVDYNNAIAISNSLVQNIDDCEKLKVLGVQVQTQQL